jgi:hypothetical protein
MQRARQGLQRWKIWVPLLLISGLLGLEPLAPLSTGGHQAALGLITLLMYGLVMGWLRHSRGALINETFTQEQAQARHDQHWPQQRALARSNSEPWEDDWPY